MKKLIFTLLAFVCVISAYGQARVQIIHNVSLQDATVDLYIYDTIKVDNFQYRQATSYLTVPANGTDSLNIKIAPDSSSTSASAFLSLMVGGINAGDTTVLFLANSDTVVEVYKYSGNISSGNPNAVALTIIHGGDDAPAVDVVARVVGNYVGDTFLADSLVFAPIDYVNSSSSASVANQNYVIDLYSAADTTRVKSYYAPIATAGGFGAVVFASGYLNPDSTQPSFGLFAALPITLGPPNPGRATVLPLSEIKSAFAQILHNSADSNATRLSIYVKNNLTGTAFQTVEIEDTLAFRSTTAVVPFEFVPGANDSITFAVAPFGSSSINDAFLSKKYKFVANTQHLIFLNGILATSTGYSPNTLFDVIVGDARFQAAAGLGTTEVNIFQGCTDAPKIDFVETNPGSTLFADDLDYGQFSGYTPVSSSNNYTVEIRDETGLSNPLNGNFFLPLGLNPQGSGAAIVVYTSGFFTPASNNGGPAVQICAKGGTKGAALCFSPIPLSVEEKNFVSNMIIYPNPTADKVNLEYMLESTQNVKVNLYNATGQLQLNIDKGIERKGRGMTTLNVSNLAKGMYLVNVLVGENVNVTRSIIVE